MAHNNIPGKITQHDTDHMGRWTYITLQGKRNKKTTFVTCYQCVSQDIRYVGPKTVYAQQYSLLGQTKTHTNTCPRFHFKQDLRRLLQDLTTDDHSIILSGDFNRSFDDNHGKLLQLATEFKLQDIMSRRHPGNLPSTYA